MIYLHPGRGKCGSSTIQRFAAANRAALQDAGVVYPALRGQRAEHHKLLGDVMQPDDRLARIASGDPSAIAVEELRCSLAANPGGSFLLSSEFFLKNNATGSAETCGAMSAGKGSK